MLDTVHFAVCSGDLTLLQELDPACLANYNMHMFRPDQNYNIWYGLFEDFSYWCMHSMHYICHIYIVMFYHHNYDALIYQRTEHSNFIIINCIICKKKNILQKEYMHTLSNFLISMLCMLLNMIKSSDIPAFL